MKITIAVRDCNAKIDDWLEISKRLGHQPSRLEANHRDEELFSRYLGARRIPKICGETMLNFISWIIEQRHNGPGAINPKISSLDTCDAHPA